MGESGVHAGMPVVVVQAEAFNRSRIPTVVVVPLTRRAELALAPGNVLVPAAASGLLGDTVALVSGVHCIERGSLQETPAVLAGPLLEAIDRGLRLVLGL